jgi:hypothetical protein
LSVEPDASIATLTGATPVCGVAVTAATGGLSTGGGVGAFTVIDTVAVDALPAVSLTVPTADQVPTAV